MWQIRRVTVTENVRNCTGSCRERPGRAQLNKSEEDPLKTKWKEASFRFRKRY